MKRIAITLSLLMLTATSTFAATVEQNEPATGTINIEVTDQNGDDFPGIWNLHQGTGDAGLRLRSGRKSESFEFNKGNYFLAPTAVTGQQAIGASHPFFLIHSENPLTLTGGGEVTFKVQYFLTEEDMQKVIDGMETTPLTEAEVQSTSTETETSTETQPEDTSADQPSIQAIFAPATEVIEEQPTLEFNPALRQAILRAKNQNAANALANGSTPEPIELAATGSPVLLIGIASMLGGAILTRKRK